MAPPLTLLVDNGSLEPAATLALRELAAKLTRRLGHTVEPVSLLHSSGIDPTQLDGRPAEILFPALEKRLAAGQSEFVILPLFFGPSQALTVYLPENLARLRAKFPSARFRLAPPLHDARDHRLAHALADRVREELDAITSRASSLPQVAADPVRVALVDHGSPVAVVTAVRDDLARQLAGLLGSRVAAVAPCSMERRPTPAYDFNEPLLAGLLATAPWSESQVIVAMQFLLPGRHAGPAGDVAEICRQAEAARPRLRTRMTGLLGSHPLLLEILADRWRSAPAVSAD
jgi:sirohydrochlorin ferrochelatase